MNASRVLKTRFHYQVERGGFKSTARFDRGLGRAPGSSAGLTDERQPVETLPQLVGETRQHAVRHLDGIGGGPACRLLLTVPGVERRERAVRPPELRRVADRLGDRPGFLERAAGIVPAPSRARGLAREAPC